MNTLLVSQNDNFSIVLYCITSVLKILSSEKTFISQQVQIIELLLYLLPRKLCFVPLKPHFGNILVSIFVNGHST